MFFFQNSKVKKIIFRIIFEFDSLGAVMYIIKIGVSLQS